VVQRRGVSSAQQVPAAAAVLPGACGMVGRGCHSLSAGHTPIEPVLTVDCTGGCHHTAVQPQSSMHAILHNTAVIHPLYLCLALHGYVSAASVPRQLTCPPCGCTKRWRTRARGCAVPWLRLPLPRLLLLVVVLVPALRRSRGWTWATAAAAAHAVQQQLECSKVLAAEAGAALGEVIHPWLSPVLQLVAVPGPIRRAAGQTATLQCRTSLQG
jgi:hypothetical protein